MLQTFLLLVLSVGHSQFQTPQDFETNSAPLKVLVFLSKDCPCSRSHRTHLNELASAHPEVVFYGVITDKLSKNNQADVANYYSAKQFQFPIIKDTEQTLVKKYDALKTPHVTLLEKQGKTYERLYQGGVSNNRSFQKSKKHFLANNLVALRSKKPLVYQQGQSLGCYIRRF